MSAREAAIREALRAVDDPELGINIVDLGLVYDVSDTGNGVYEVRMTLTSMGCPLTEHIAEQVHAACAGLEGVRRVRIEWVWDPPWTPEAVSEEARLYLRVLGY